MNTNTNINKLEICYLDEIKNIKETQKKIINALQDLTDFYIKIKEKIEQNNNNNNVYSLCANKTNYIFFN